MRTKKQLRQEVEGRILQLVEVEQILGKVLGYPWYKDDQKNFPGATEDDGVCVGEHVPETLAEEAASRILELQRLISTSKDEYLRLLTIKKWGSAGGKVGPIVAAVSAQIEAVVIGKVDTDFNVIY